MHSKPPSENQLRRSLRLFCDITKGLNEVFWSCNLGLTRMLYISPGYERLWGRSCRSLYENPRSFIDAVHPLDRLLVERALQKRIRSGGLKLEYRIIRPDGSIRWIWDQGFRLPASGGEPARMVGMAQDITERKQVEAELSTRQRQWTAAQSLAPMASWEWEPATDAANCSDEFYRMFGLEPGQIPATGQAFSEMVVAEDRPCLDAAVQATLRSRRPFSAEYRIRRLDGTERILSSRGALLNANAGLPARMVGIVQDVTERRRAELALRESEARFRTLIEHSNDLIWALDAEGRFTFASKKCEEVTGYRFEQFRGQIFTVLAFEADIPAVVKVFQAVMKGQPRRYEVRVRRADGTVFLVSANSAPIRSNGRVVGVVSFGRDITRQRAAEEALRKSEERFRLLACATNDGIWDWDRLSNQVWWNDRYNQLFGPRPKEATSGCEWWSKRLHPEDRLDTVRSFNAALASRQGHWSGEYRLVRPDGRVVFVYSRCYFRRNAAGVATRVLGAMLDTTARHEAELELQHVRGRLLASQDQERRRLSRELHDSTAQKLAALAVQSGLLEEALRAQPKAVRQLASDCRQMAEDCAQEIRSVARLLHPPLLDELGLEVALDSYLTGFARSCGLAVSLEIDPAVKGLNKERALALFRVIQEALSNVLRHSGSSSARVQLLRARQRVIVEVSDRGRGISPTLLQRLRTRPFEVGLGIISMRERLEQLEGTLEISSSKAGTIVRALIPLRADGGAKKNLSLTRTSCVMCVANVL